MKERKQTGVVLGLVVSVSSIISGMATMLLSNYYNHLQYQRFGYFFRKLSERQPQIQQPFLEILKESAKESVTWSGENILSAYGYQVQHFSEGTQGNIILLWGLCLVIGLLLFLFSFWLWHRREVFYIRRLTEYLEQVNTRGGGLLLSASADEFSKLQDEIYKTVTNLYQTQDMAITSRNHFAENLSNIAHQLKTPVTAISLLIQVMQEEGNLAYLSQVKKQLGRLMHLEEALLLLSRIDAGQLPLKREKVDVFTVLTLAADNLQELLEESDVTIDIPEMGEAEIIADLDWTMEAFMNLFKNCMEHTPEGTSVHCTYEQNPLYTKIRIWDEGTGFCKNDIPHLFERFYRGKDAKEGGIGIGLSLAKEIFEMQNGFISTGNGKDGGAFFEIRIYSH